MLNNLVIMIIFSLSFTGICFVLAFFLFFKYQVVYIARCLGYFEKFQQIIERFQIIFQATQILFRKKDEGTAYNQQNNPSGINKDLAINDSVLKTKSDVTIDDYKPEIVEDSHDYRVDQTIQLTNDYFIIIYEEILLASTEKLNLTTIKEKQQC